MSNNFSNKYVKINYEYQQNKTCDQLDKEWNKGITPSSLRNEWNNCTDSPIKDKDPIWKKLNPYERQKNTNLLCCKEVLQCNNPNEWLKKNNIQFSCPDSGQPSPYPHFGDLRPESKTLWGII